MNGEERSYGWVRPTSRHLSREIVHRYGVRNSRSFVSKYSYGARFKPGSSISWQAELLYTEGYNCRMLVKPPRPND
ncbi:unnamed protein product [Acanthocheilonema viteae]|uniref:Uncharacterized protein n=1 Tax=Acanthocheilonema viteae TaxID=6277 RepID=A0A498SKH2_ACAVI|nr:unnamed protein product [Acanthocheilonema viteae]